MNEGVSVWRVKEKCDEDGMKERQVVMMNAEKKREDASPFNPFRRDPSLARPNTTFRA
jgi:hypothetical protein